jgi:hypothetical protein
VRKTIRNDTRRTYPRRRQEELPGEQRRHAVHRSRRAQDSPGGQTTMTFSASVAATAFFLATCAGCATTSTLGPLPSDGSQKIAAEAAEVLIDGVTFTRATGREVAGLCWSDRATDRLASVVQVDVGGQAEVGLALPLDARSTRIVSCTWHTHSWDPDVIPGPSKSDLRSSAYPLVSGIAHFVLDRQGIWHYAHGRIIEMCPWNSAGSNFDPTRCRSGFASPADSYPEVVRSYGQRD